MVKPIDNRRPPVPRVDIFDWSDSPREGEDELEMEEFDDFVDFKRCNFPQANLMLTEAPLLIANNVGTCKQQLRPETIFDNGSLRPIITTTATGKGVTATATNTFIFDVPVPRGIASTYTDTPDSISLRSDLTDTSNNQLRSEQEEKERTKKRQRRRPVYKPLDFSQLIVQKPRHHLAEKIVAGILEDLLDNLELCEETGNQDSENESSETEIKVTRFHRFGRNLKSLKTRFLRAMTPLTCCFRRKSTHVAE